MQATKDAEHRFHVNIRMGDKRVRTKHTYTREQAEEIGQLVTESAREALGGDEIAPVSDADRTQ